MVLLLAAAFASPLPATGFAAGGSGSGRDPAQQAEQQERPLFGADVSMVTVNVSVLDERGLPVSGLSTADFRVFDDGDAQQVAMVLRPDDVPADIALLVDLSGSVRDDAMSLRRDAAAFLDALSPADCVYFLPFANEIGEGTWGHPRDEGVRAALERTRIGGATPLFDALIRAIGALGTDADHCGSGGGEGSFSSGSATGGGASPEAASEARPGARRRAVVVLTDGGDTSSQAAYSAAINAAAVAGVPVFPVAIGSALTEGQGANLGAGARRDAGMGAQADARLRSRAGNGLMSDNERGREFDYVAQAAGQGAQERYGARMRSYGLGLAESLREIADASGGLYIDGGAGETALQVAYTEVLTWLRASYVVGYYPPPRPRAAASHRGLAVWHRLEVQTVNGALRVYARPGYFRRDVDPVAAGAAVEAGVEMLQDGLAREAISAFGEGLDADPFSWQAHYYRGRALGTLGLLSDARDDFLAAARLGPGIGEVHEFAAIASADLGDGATAWEHAIRAMQGGYDMSQRIEMLRAVSPRPADLDERVAAPRLFVGRAVIPDPEAQAFLEAVLRAVRLAISESHDFALVTDAGVADHILRLQIDELDTAGLGRVRGVFEVHEPGGDREYHDDFSIAEVFNDDLSAAVFDGLLSAFSATLRPPAAGRLSASSPSPLGTERVDAHGSPASERLVPTTISPPRR